MKCNRIWPVIDILVGNSAETSPEKCSNCVYFKTHCTHLYLSKDNHGSTLNFKNSREHVAAILSPMTVYVPASDPAVLYQSLVEIAKYARNLEELLAISSSSSLNLLSTPFGDASTDQPAAVAQTEPRSDTSEDEDDGVFVGANIMEPMSRLALRPSNTRSELDESYRFFGKSSYMNFIKTAMDDVDNVANVHTFEAQRPEFWNFQSWHPHPEPLPPLTFPPDDLLQDLIDIYFQHLNPIVFLLHSSTFRASVADGEHLRDHHFGAVVLGVCAIASRHSNDPRVLMAPDAPLHSCGWKYFTQTRPLQTITFPCASNSQFRTLYNLQLCSLTVLFLATADVRACWVISGLGVRLAQEIGAHRRSRYTSGAKLYGELLKRAFWALFSMDTVLNSVLGRPTIANDDFDVELPDAVDDQYLNEANGFQQPPNKPASAAYITLLLS
ncbi:fungal-specific transcription factor domain-containing protein [Favolaschia claudopus]|uniref:Fungal-specific transcription factor domain-containing protein n=1 Tax=Favolaschia claudopus TaxID=2862362 RepID=A0AAW0ED49_9AGAR